MWSLTPPEVRNLEVFTRLPNGFRKPDVLNPWSRANRLGVPGDSFLEGPVFDKAGNRYVTDVEYGRIFRIDGDGEWALVTEYDGEPNGMRWHGPGELMVADYRNGPQLLDVATGAVTAFLDRRSSERFKGINDLVFDSVGYLYFTDQGQTGLHDPTGRVYRLGADGRLLPSSISGARHMLTSSPTSHTAERTTPRCTAPSPLPGRFCIPAACRPGPSMLGGMHMIVMVNSYPLPVRPSVAAPDRSAVWDWLAPLMEDGTVECFYPKPGRGAVAVFHVDSAETLQGHLTEWAERVPCTFEVTLLVDVAYQKRMVGHTSD